MTTQKTPQQKIAVMEMTSIKKVVGYAMTIVAFQEIEGGVKDENVYRARKLVHELQELCQDETGVFLSNYPAEFLQNNAEQVKELLPYTIKKALEGGKKNGKM